MKMPAASADFAALRARSKSIKLRFLAMYKKANAGHIGCSLSCADILAFTRFGWMSDGDRLILSKGHAAAALYSTLAEDGTLSEADIATFYQDGTKLAAHPPPGLVPESPFATGSLGHGLSIAAGLALGLKLQKRPGRVFCLTSDGELNEGSIWEAALFVAHHKLDNLVWIIDRNGIQGFGRTEDVMALEPLTLKLQSFGITAIETSGHDFPALNDARDQVNTIKQPTVLVCKTVKGHGVSFMANTIACHYLPMSDAQYKQAVEEITSEQAVEEITDKQETRHAS